jgi:hypothetical protein
VLVTRLLPWSETLSRLEARTRVSDPECCVDFARAIRNPLLRILRSNPIGMKQTLIALSGSYANSDSIIEADLELMDLLSGAILKGHCDAAISVLDRCSLFLIPPNIWLAVVKLLPVKYDLWYLAIYNKLCNELQLQWQNWGRRR